MTGTKSVSFNKLFVATFLALIFGSMSIESKALAGSSTPASKGAAVMQNANVGESRPARGTWKEISQAGDISTVDITTTPGNDFAITYGADGAKITYRKDRKITAFNLNGKKPGDIISPANISVGSVVDTKLGGSKLIIRNYMSEREFDSLRSDQEFQQYLNDKNGFQKLLTDNESFFSGNENFKSLSNEEIFKNLFVESIGKETTKVDPTNKTFFTHNITFTGEGANPVAHGFTANPNTYSGFGHLDISSCESREEIVAISSKNKELIHWYGTEAKPNFVFSHNHYHFNTHGANALVINTPFQVNEWSLKGFDRINVASTLELIERNNTDFTPPLNKMKLVYVNDNSMLVLGTDARDGKTLTLGKLVQPTKDDQYRIGFRSIAAGGVLAVNQNGNNIGSSNKRYRELVIDGSGGTKLAGAGEIHAKSIVIKDDGDEIIFDKEINSGEDSVLRFDAKSDSSRTLRVRENLTITAMDFNGKNTKLLLENGKTIASNLSSIGTGELHALSGWWVGDITDIESMLISGSFGLNGDAAVQRVELDQALSDFIIENGKKVSSAESVKGVGGSKIQFLGNGTLASPIIQGLEIHSNGPDGSIVRLEANNVESELLKFANKSIVSVTGNFKGAIIDYNNKPAILELIGEGSYDFNPTEVKNVAKGDTEAERSTLNIIGRRNTNSSKIFEFAQINLGKEASDKSTADLDGYLLIDIVRALNVPSTSRLDFKSKNSVLHIMNSSKTEDAVLTLNTDLAVLDSKNGFIILESINGKTLTIEKGDEVAKSSKIVSLGSGPRSGAEVQSLGTSADPELLQKLTIIGNVVIPSGPRKVDLGRTSRVDIMAGAKFFDFGGGILDSSVATARVINLGVIDDTKKSITGPSVWISGVEGTSTVQDGTAVNFNDTASSLEMENVGDGLATQIFGGSIQNASRGEINIVGGAGGMNVQRSSTSSALKTSKAVDTLAALNIYDTVTFLPTGPFDLSGVNTIAIFGTLIDQTGTTKDAKSILVGASSLSKSFSGRVSAATPGTYVYDVVGGNQTIPVTNIHLVTVDSLVVLCSSTDSSSPDDRTITMQNSLVSPSDSYGIVEIDSADRKLTIDRSSDGVSIGANGKRMKAIRFSGAGDFNIRPALFTENIQLNVPKIALADVNANVVFLAATKYQANGNINGTVDFNGNNGEITVATGASVGDIYNSVGNRAGTVIFGREGDPTKNLKVMFGGVGTSNKSLKALAVSTGNLGTANSWLSNVSFDTSRTVGDVYATTINVAAGQTATFAGTNSRNMQVPSVTVNGANLPRTLGNFGYNTEVGSNSFTMSSTGKALFSNAALVNAPINGGQLEFGGDVWLTKPVSGATSATFAPGSYVLLGNNFAANNIVAKGVTILATAPTVAVTGQMAAENSAVDLGTSQIQYTGNAQLSGTFTINTIYNSATKQGGTIQVANGSTLNFADVSQVLVTLQANSNINDIPANGLKYPVILSTNGLTAYDIQKVTLNSKEQNQSVIWTVASFDNNNLILQAKSNFVPPVPFIPHTDAGRYLDDYSRMTPEQQRESWGRLTQRTAKMELENDIYQAVTSLLNQVNAYIDQRAIGNNQVNNKVGDNQVIAAGDDDSKNVYGAWFTPFVTKGKQNMRNGVSGFQENSSGAIIGFDGLVNDQIMLGVVYSRIETKLSHKDIKQGDRTKGKTDIYGIYGLYNVFNSSWFGEGIATYGTTRIKNSEARLTSTAWETASANYRATSYGGQLLAGYNYQLTQQAIITPLVGARYSRFEDLGYKEYGTRFENLIVQKRKYNKIEGILGLRGQTVYALDQVQVIPEIHGYVNYDFKGSSPIIDARLDGMYGPLPTKSWKPSRAFYIVGTGVTAKYKNSEYGAVYNCNIADKYLGHQVALKLRLNL